MTTMWLWLLCSSTIEVPSKISHCSQPTVTAMPKCSSVNNEHKNILLLPAFNVQAPSDISSQNVWDNNNWQDYEQHKYSYC